MMMLPSVMTASLRMKGKTLTTSRPTLLVAMQKTGITEPRLVNLGIAAMKQATSRRAFQLR